MSNVYFFGTYSTGVFVPELHALLASTPDSDIFRHRKVRIDAVSTPKDSGKESTKSFAPTDEIEKPFAKFSSIGAEIADGIDYADWARVTRFLTNSDFGPSDDGSVEGSEVDGSTGNKVVATAGVLSSRNRRGTAVDRSFKREPPPRFGKLIELVRCLPPHDSLAFRLLHPLIVGIEKGEWLINFETGMLTNARFLQIVNKLFEKSTSEITNNQRSGIKGWGRLEVFSCAFWRSVSLSDDAEDLTGEYWRLILNEDYEAYSKLTFEQQDSFELVDERFEKFLALKYWTVNVNGEEIDLDKRLITLDRAFRFGLQRELIEFLIGDNPFACSTRMADLYESFYILHDIAYMSGAGYTEGTVSNRSVRDSPTLLITDDGYVRLHKSLFWDVVREEQIRAAQIRSCPVLHCRRIFWAKARNQVCCTPRCANLHEAHKKRYPTAEAQAAYIDRWNTRQRKRLNRKPRTGASSGWAKR